MSMILFQQPRRLAATDPGNIILILQECTERVIDGLTIQSGHYSFQVGE